MNLVQLHADIAKTFPKIWIKEGSLFDNAHCESLWTGEGSVIEIAMPAGEIDGNPIEGGTVELSVFDMCPMFDNMYTFGVLNLFAEFLRQRGYFAEAYDSGTFFIWKA